MSEFNLIWRKYGLKDNPYFNSPLTIDGGTLSLSSFIGRKKEQETLKAIIRMGGEVRCLIVGDPGVGKTSLLNYVRYNAASNQFFTPAREVEINRVMNGNELIILTLSSIFEEIQKQDLPITDSLKQKLEAFYELNAYGENFMEVVNTSQLNRQKLIALFEDTIKEIVYPRFKGIIIHYDNLDNIDNHEGLLEMISDVRDFLLTKNVIFFFVGDEFLPSVISAKDRVNSIFLKPEINVPPLSLLEVQQILEERISKLSINERSKTITPHTGEAVKILFQLYQGNIREILNGLQNCVIELASSNTPLQITEEILRDTLYEKAKTRLSKLTLVEKELFEFIKEMDHFTPTELSEKGKKNLQNISSKYLPNLMKRGVVRFVGKEGRNSFYSITSEMRWLKLYRSQQEKSKSLQEVKKRVGRKIQKEIGEFFE